ncbi:VOC family protein [Actinoplanes sp. NBRC 103695]|uniref:VOC family protein n=1 Tax=Actinoplanes sp. NBRC 103695 TaxID=3032202 RepID=UPI0024A46720|nr:VOC family protein [Actinoplanes sp. NBRC 103695]GLZ00858.1 hypothetical protein Acsp02_81100 [Actinoplanes sp. NBRC 103695]
MANQTGRPVAPARKLVAAVLGTFAVFVMVFGLGLSSWPIVALGAALLALAIALGMVNVVRRGARAWVTGHGQVKAISEPPPSGAYGRAELQLVVVAPGLPVTEVLVRDPRVPVGKWPRVNETLPISVDVDDMRRVKIEWADVEDRADDGDPPPPAFEQPEEFLDDDLLGEPEAPPWVTRDRSWGRGPDEPMSPAAAATSVATEERPGSAIVVHDTPGGPVLEGEYVDHDDIPAVLPQRAARSPHAEAQAAATSLTDDRPTPEAPLLDDPEPERRPEPDPEPAPAPEDRQPPPVADEPPPAAPHSTTYYEQPTPAPHQRTASPTTEATPSSYTPTTDQTHPAYQPVPPTTTESDEPTERRRPSPRPRKPSEPTSETLSGTPSHSPTATPAPAGPKASVVPEQRAAGVPGSDSPDLETPPRPRSPESLHEPTDHDIDLPLDSNLDSPPEFAPASRESLSSDVIAPPADAPDDPRAWAAGATAATPPSEIPTAKRPPSPREDTVTPPEQVAAAAAADRAAATGDTSPRPWEASRLPDEPPPPPTASAATTRPWEASRPTTDPSPKPPANEPPSRPAAYEPPSPSEPPAADSLLEDPLLDDILGDPGPPPWETREAANPRPTITGVDPTTPTKTPAASAPTPEATHPTEPPAATSQPPTAPTEVPAATSQPPTAPTEVPAATATDAAPTPGQKPIVVSATARPVRPGRPWADLEGSGYEPDERTDEIITAYPSARPGPAGAIHGVGITVLVTNMNRSIDFYRDTLGFFQIDTGTGSAVLASGDTRLVLRAVHSLSPDIGRLIYLNLEVGDVDAVYEELKTKGVKFLHGPRPVNRGDKLELWAATFYDPDGHNIAITQWRAIR